MDPFPVAGVMVMLGLPVTRGRCSGIETQGRNDMVRKIITVALIAGGLTMAACNTVRGAARDVNSAANATQNAMH